MSTCLNLDQTLQHGVELFRFIYVYFVYIIILSEWKYVRYMCEDRKRLMEALDPRLQIV